MTGPVRPAATSRLARLGRGPPRAGAVETAATWTRRGERAESSESGEDGAHERGGAREAGQLCHVSEALQGPLSGRCDAGLRAPGEGAEITTVDLGLRARAEVLRGREAKNLKKPGLGVWMSWRI